MIQRSSMVTLGTAAIAFGTFAISAAPAAADPITFDVEASVSREVTVDSTFAAIANSFFPDLLPEPLTGGTVSVDESFSYSATLDDDPAQYMDGDISFGVDMLESIFGVSLDASTIALIDGAIDLDFSGSGTLANGSENLDFNLGYDSTNNEIIATFLDFDSSIFEACFIGSCTTAGNFAFNINTDPTYSLAAFLPETLAFGTGTFSILTTPQGVSSDDGSESSSEGNGNESPSEGNGNESPSEGNDSESPSEGNDNEGSDGGSTNDSPQSVPEPTTVLGLLGIGGFLASRRKGSRAA